MAFRWNGSTYEIDPNSAFNYDRLIAKHPTHLSTTAWDYDGDGDKDIFFQQFNDNGIYGDPNDFDGLDSCFAWHEDLDAEANDLITHGFYFHNDNGTLIKTNLSQKEDECDCDLGFGQIN